MVPSPHGQQGFTWILLAQAYSIPVPTHLHLHLLWSKCCCHNIIESFPHDRSHVALPLFLYALCTPYPVFQQEFQLVTHGSWHNSAPIQQLSHSCSTLLCIVIVKRETSKLRDFCSSPSPPPPPIPPSTSFPRVASLPPSTPSLFPLQSLSRPSAAIQLGVHGQGTLSASHLKNGTQLLVTISCLLLSLH